MKWRVMIASGLGTDWLYDGTTDGPRDFTTEQEARQAAEAYIEYTVNDPFLAPLMDGAVVTVETMQ